MIRPGRRPRASTLTARLDECINREADWIVIGRAAAAMRIAADAATGHHRLMAPGVALEDLTDADLAHIASWGPGPAREAAAMLNAVHALHDDAPPQIVQAAATLARAWLHDHP